MRLILAVVLIFSIIISTSAFTAKLKIYEYSKIPVNKEVTSQWVERVSDVVDIKYHLYNGEELLFRFEVRGKNNKPIQRVDAAGHIAIVGTEDGKRMGSSFAQTFNKDNHFMSKWLNIPSRFPGAKENVTRSNILNPDNKRWDAEKDLLTAEHRFEYIVQETTYPNFSSHDYNADVILDLA